MRKLVLLVGHKLLEAEASGYLIHQVRASGKAQWGSTL